uniref:J domain-containing protein n=1 Tax=Aegilops tauschii subsp. strangulata TaxID=200361 RepID=A0A453JSV0_AEGTS
RHTHTTQAATEHPRVAMAGCGEKSDAGVGLYAVLGVASDCSDAELRSAYRKLAMKWHPDKCGSGSSGGSEAAKGRFQKIQAAYAGKFIFLWTPV